MGKVIRMTKSIKSIFYLILSLGAILSGCKNNSTKLENTCVFSKAIDGTTILEEKSETIGNFADCKLIDFQNEVYIVANLASELSIKKINDSNSSFKVTNPVVSSSWLDVIEDKGSILCVTASFKEKSLRLYKIDMQSLNIELLSTVHQYDEQLLIDPTMLKVEDKYFITYTQIKGNINNADTLKPNGHYEVVLLESNDLTNWKELSSIVSEDTILKTVFYTLKQRRIHFVFCTKKKYSTRTVLRLKLKNLITGA